MQVFQKLLFLLVPCKPCAPVSEPLKEPCPAFKQTTACRSTAVQEKRSQHAVSPRSVCDDEELIFHFEAAPVTDEEVTVDPTLVENMEAALDTNDPYLHELRPVVESVAGKCLDEIASHLAARNYVVVKRTVNYPGALSMVKLRNSYLVVFRKPDLTSVWDGHMEEILVEPNFRSRFIVGFDQPYYDAFVQKLPRSLVARREAFSDVALMGAAEMEKAFIRQRELIPLWRTHKATLSNWFSDVIEEEHVGAENKLVKKTVPGSNCASFASLHSSATGLALESKRNTGDIF